MSKKPVKDNDERYLKLPNRILNMRELSLPTRLLLAYFDSFGRAGCWSNNGTLAAIFDVSTRTITERIGQLKRARRIWWVFARSPHRTVWSNTHPAVKAADTLLYRGREILKADIITRQIGSGLLGSKLPSNIEGNCQVTSQDRREPHGSPLLTDKNRIKKEIKKPALAGGGQPALLKDRESERRSNIERFKGRFGSRGRLTPGLTPAECEQSKQSQLKALHGLGTEKLEQLI
jgi:hypothetical protein